MSLDATAPPATRPWAHLLRFSDETYTVDTHDVPTSFGIIQWLIVRREDGAEVRSWDELQRIKNEIAGPERLAVECYPPQDEVVNKENARHLWVLPVGWVFPVLMMPRLRPATGG